MIIGGQPFGWTFQRREPADYSVLIEGSVYSGHRTEVYRCRIRHESESRSDSTEAAVKLIHKTTTILEQRALKEVTEHQLVSLRPHPNIIRFLGECRARKFSDGPGAEWPWIGLLLEYVPSSLEEIISLKRLSFKSENPIVVRVIIWQILRGLSFLHQTLRCHGDICPGNVLVDDRTMAVKLCDFGQVQKYTAWRERQLWAGQRECEIYIGTPAYTAPEILQGLGYYDNKVDLWSVGCLFAEMIGDFDRPFFVDGDYMVQTPPRKQLNVIANVLGLDCELAKQPLAELENEVVDWHKLYGIVITPLEKELLSGLLLCNPLHRMDAIQAMESRYFLDLLTPGLKLPSGKQLPPLFNFLEEEVVFFKQGNSKLWRYNEGCAERRLLLKERHHLKSESSSWDGHGLPPIAQRLYWQRREERDRLYQQDNSHSKGHTKDVVVDETLDALDFENFVEETFKQESKDEQSMSEASSNSSVCDWPVMPYSAHYGKPAKTKRVDRELIRLHLLPAPTSNSGWLLPEQTTTNRLSHAASPSSVELDLNDSLSSSLNDKCTSPENHDGTDQQQHVSSCDVEFKIDEKTISRPPGLQVNLDTAMLEKKTLAILSPDTTLPVDRIKLDNENEYIVHQQLSTEQQLLGKNDQESCSSVRFELFKRRDYSNDSLASSLSSQDEVNLVDLQPPGFCSWAQKTLQYLEKQKQKTV